MNKVYAPGCALVIYKPHLAEKMLEFLNRNVGLHPIPNHLICCKHEPKLEKGTQIISTCTGCDRRYRELYEGISTVSVWETLASSSFPFPDYGGIEMTVHDACPARTEERIHNAIRTLLQKMNIKIIEPSQTRTKSVCCGDSFHGTVPITEVKELMKKRAMEMPCEDVAVYCISCIKAMHIGGKKPRYLFDLLFGEATEIGTFEPDEWHNELNRFIETH